jgi:hypothetical protein
MDEPRCHFQQASRSAAGTAALTAADARRSESS